MTTLLPDEGFPCDAKRSVSGTVALPFDRLAILYICISLRFLAVTSHVDTVVSTVHDIVDILAAAGPGVRLWRS